MKLASPCRLFQPKACLTYGSHCLPRNFRVHKVLHNRQMYTVVNGLSHYGELDRVVTGLLPLREIPVEKHRVPDYSTLAGAIATAHFFSARAGRTDLVETLQPLWDVAERLYFVNTEYWTSGRAFNGSLDFTEEEIRDRSHWSEHMWVGSYVHETANLGHAHLLGGSKKYPRPWLLKEIDRYATTVFTTLGYEPFTDH